ncbi:MAG: hypothetical protein ABSG96_05755 [Terracidiphilus sp.]|jgi:hypothetical protein
MSIQSDSFLCGWRVRSEIPLMELLPWPATEAAVDVQIGLGQVPPFTGATTSHGRFTLNGAGHCRIEIPGIATFLVREGREIVIDLLVDPDSLELRNYLFGTVLGFLCHQRGVFPLHGSCLRLGESAVIFSGNSGAGKSALAATFAVRGYTLLADDVCVLSEGDGGWVVWPAFPRVKLKSAAHRAIFGVEPERESPSLLGKHHFRFEPVRSFCVKPVPLAAIYFLEKAPLGESESIAEVPGLRRLAMLQNQIFRCRAGFLLGRGPALFASTSRIASVVSIRRLCRSLDFARMDATIAMLEAAHRVPASSVSLEV